PLIRAPRNYAAKASMLVRIGLTRRGLRQLASRGLRDPGVVGTVGRAAILADIVKLFVLLEAAAGGVPGVVGVEAVRDGARVRVVTQTHGKRTAPSPLSTLDPDLTPEGIEWDNRRLGHVVTFPTIIH